jgi:glycosyltransferase involved in cell wall biosynthesis
MKIHFITNNTVFTGGHAVLFDHANALAERGHDARIWVPCGGTVGWMDVRVPLCHLDVKAIKSLPAADVCVFDRPRFAEQLYRAGKGIPVHFCQLFVVVNLDLRLARLAGWLNVRERWRLKRRRRAIDRAYSLPTVKMAIQRQLCDHFASRYGQRSYLVPNGLPADVFTPGTVGERESCTVLVVGPTDIAWKRIPDALEAVRILKQRRPEVRLVRVSQHPMGDAERQLGVTDEYHTLLPPEELARQYRRSTVMAYPSDDTEGFGLPMLEALACGTPLVAGDIAAARALDVNGGHARLVPVGRPDLLAQELAMVLDSPGEQDRLRQRGLEVAARYTRERSHDAMEEALTEIVAGRLRAAG